MEGIKTRAFLPFDNPSRSLRVAWIHSPEGLPMPETHPDGSQQQAARLAGVALLVSWPLVVYANFAIQDRLVAGDAAATARNLLAHAGLFRLGIALDRVHGAALRTLGLALDAGLRPVHAPFAGLAAA